MRAVSHGNDRVSWARISNDSKQVAFTRDFGGREAHQFYTTLLAREAEEKQLTQLSPTRVVDFNWSHNDKTIAFAGSTSETNGVCLLNPETGDVTEAYRLKHWVFNPAWSPDDSKISVSAKTTEHTTALEIVTLDPTVKENPVVYAPPEEVPLPNGFHGGFFNSSVKVARSGEYLVFSWSSLSSPPSLSRYDLKTREVETLNEHFTDLPLGRAEHVTYNSFDGRQIHGWFLKPAHLTGKRPCILWIHGGPAWEVADAWNPAIQSFLVAGYTLFAPNIRGSTGYGVEFQNLNIHDVGGGDLRDVEEAAKYLRSRPEVDPMRIALVGASYGGYMTNLGMTKLPEYWAAGASIVGITDWKEMYDLSDALFRSFIERYFGTPEENPELYQTRSPINYVQNIRAPLLIWHRGNDSRCPLAPVEKFAARLKQLNKKYEMQVVWDEGHGFQKTENLARQYKAIVQFLDKQLGPPS